MKMKLTLAAILMVCGSSASAVQLNLDAGWSRFEFEDVGSDWSDEFTFTIDPGSAAIFAVTDAFLSGDQFSFFVNDVSAGVTSLPTSQGDSIGNDPDAAFADDRWSSGELLLGEGDYTVTGNTVLSPFGSGAAYAQLTSQSSGGPVIAPPSVPLPAAGFTLLLGLGALLGARRRPRA